MDSKQTRRPSGGGTGATDFRQEIMTIIQQSSREPWVIREAEIIQEARDIRTAWELVLGLKPSRRAVIV